MLWIVLGALLLVAAASGTALAVLADRTPTHPVPTLAATQAAATRQLTTLGFKVHTEHLRRDGTKPGQVLGSRPAAGRRVAEGHTVTLLVSDGQTLVKVPAHLAGKPEAAAVAFLKHQGLAVAPSQHQYSETVAAGTVLSYVGSPPAQLPRGSTVRLLVSAGPKPRVLPDVSGLTPAQAAQQLTNLGLVPVTVKQFSDSVDSGGLIGLNPASGQSVGRGSTVQVVVSKGPELVAVPSMKGIKSHPGRHRRRSRPSGWCQAPRTAVPVEPAQGLRPGQRHDGAQGQHASTSSFTCSDPPLRVRSWLPGNQLRTPSDVYSSVTAFRRAAISRAAGSGVPCIIPMILVMSPLIWTLPDMKACMAACWFWSMNTARAVS